MSSASPTTKDETDFNKEIVVDNTVVVSRDEINGNHPLATGDHHHHYHQQQNKEFHSQVNNQKQIMDNDKNSTKMEISDTNLNKEWVKFEDGDIERQSAQPAPLLVNPPPTLTKSVAELPHSPLKQVSHVYLFI